MNSSVLQVAAGVVVNADGKVLVAKRPLEKHQGGLWEFPGGKIEQGESPHGALARELAEEVGIRIITTEPLIQIQHAYADKTVCLNVLHVTEFAGEAWGCEGQHVAWVAPEELTDLAFPAANKAIVTAAQLPRRLMITGAFSADAEFLQLLRQGVDRGAGMVQFRAPWLPPEDYIRLARKAHSLCQSHRIPLLANCAVKDFPTTECDGLHLTSARLRDLNTRPIDRSLWLSASCHSLAEVRQAAAIGVDFVNLSPVRATKTHVERAGMGWEEFASIVEQATMPVFALGGMKAADMSLAMTAGAQGIAGIGEFWKS